MILALIVLVAAAVVVVALIVALLIWRRRPRGIYLPRTTTKGRTPPAVRRARATQRKAMMAHRRGTKAFRR